MGIYHRERNVSSLAMLFKFAVQIISRISYVLVLYFVIIIIFVVFVVVVTVTEVCAVHSSLPALAALGDTPFLDTTVLHKMSDGLRCGG